MKFVVEFNTDNAAFGNDRGDPAWGQEVARILREVVDKIERDYTIGTIRDLNGNTVGRFGVQTGEVK